MNRFNLNPKVAGIFCLTVCLLVIISMLGQGPGPRKKSTFMFDLIYLLRDLRDWFNEIIGGIFSPDGLAVIVVIFLAILLVKSTRPQVPPAP